MQNGNVLGAKAQSSLTVLQRDVSSLLDVLKRTVGNSNTPGLADKLQHLVLTVRMWQQDPWATDEDFSIVQLPLERCRKACQAVHSGVLDAERPGKMSEPLFRTMSTFCLGDSFRDFESVITGYKSLLQVALQASSRRLKSSSFEDLQEISEMIVRTEHRFQARLRSINSNQELARDADWEGELRKERDAVLAGLAACRTLLSRVNSLKVTSPEGVTPSSNTISHIENYGTGDVFQVMVSTDNEPFQGKNEGFGGVIRQLGGRLSDLSVQKVARDMRECEVNPRSESPQPTHDDEALRKYSVSRFQGGGVKLGSPSKATEPDVKVEKPQHR